MMTEQQWDRKLKIRTVGIEDAHADLHHNRCEPTPYAVLERLVESGYVTKDSKWIDYGCGKGRVGFYLHHRTGCRVTGVECDPDVYAQALENQISYGSELVTVRCGFAETFPVGDADHFYFFNPFSVEILRAVLRQIMASWYENPRTMRLFFYYPTDDYLTELMTSDLVLLDKIDCKDLFFGDFLKENIIILQV